MSAGHFGWPGVKTSLENADRTMRDKRGTTGKAVSSYWPWERTRLFPTQKTYKHTQVDKRCSQGYNELFIIIQTWSNMAFRNNLALAFRLRVHKEELSTGEGFSSHYLFPSFYLLHFLPNFVLDNSLPEASSFLSGWIKENKPSAFMLHHRAA